MEMYAILIQYKDLDISIDVLAAKAEILLDSFAKVESFDHPINYYHLKGMLTFKQAFVLRIYSRICFERSKTCPLAKIRC